jgi:hypothetical protein
MLLKFCVLNIEVPRKHIWNFYALWASKRWNETILTLTVKNIIVGIRLG